MANLKDVCAHYAICSLFGEYAEQTSTYCYAIERKDYQSSDAGKAKLASGRVVVTSETTLESADLCFSVLHRGDHTMNCGVGTYPGEEAYQTMKHEISDSFDKGDFFQTIRLIGKRFGTSSYSLKSLFRDEQRTVSNLIMESAIRDAEDKYRQIYEYHAPMMRFLNELKIPSPKSLSTAAEVTINGSLRRAFAEKGFSPEQIESLLTEANEMGIALDAGVLELTFRKTIEGMLEGLFNDPTNISRMKRIEAALELLGSLPFQVNLWKAQNIFYEMLQGVYAEFEQKADEGDKKAREYLKHFKGIGDKLYVSVEEMKNQKKR
jgi:hypothetical protein